MKSFIHPAKFLFLITNEKTSQVFFPRNTYRFTDFRDYINFCFPLNNSFKHGKVIWTDLHGHMQSFCGGGVT